MLNKCATWLTDTLYCHCSPEQNKRPVFIYGFELTLSTMSSCASILLISALLQNFFSSLIFLGIFFFLRLFSGGYHAPTYAKCFLLTNAVYLMAYGAALALAELHSSLFITVVILITVLSAIVIFILAPVRNKHHPLSDAVYLRNQKKARTLVIVESFATITLVVLGVSIVHVAMLSTSLAAVAALMIIVKVKERLT